MNQKFKSMIKENYLNIDSRIFERIEFVIYCLNRVGVELDTNMLNMYFTQYYKKYYAPKDSNQKILYMLRKKYHQYYNKKQLEIDLEQYLNIPEKFRLFVKNDDILVLNPKIMIFVDRAVEYDKLIVKYSEKKPKVPIFIKDKGFYERTIRYGQGYDRTYQMEEFKFILDDNEIGCITQLPRYRKKKKLKLKLDFDWEAFKYKLGDDWAKRPSIQIEPCKTLNDEIEYKGLIHIVGLLGAGKSTYILQETVRLLENNDIKIGIIVPNVAEVIKTYEVLKQLGVKAMPIIGDLQLKKHRSRYMNSRFRVSDSFNAIIDEQNSVIEYLSGQCLLSHYANDYDILPIDFPCNQLKKEKEEDKSYYCPLFDSCGYLKKHLDLVKTDVWITTSHSILASKTKSLVDPYLRTYYELFHDYLDIIFVDEADSVQEDFDNKFMTDDIFYGGNNSIMRKFQDIEKILKEEGIANRESEAHRWIINYSHLIQLINRLEFLIINTPAYRKCLIGDIVTPNNLFFSIIGELADLESQESKIFIECLKSFLPLSAELKLNEKLMDHKLFRLYDKLSKCPNFGNVESTIEEILNDFINEFGLVFKSLDIKYDVKKLVIKKLELFIYIVLIDYYFRIQNKTINNITKKVSKISSIFLAFKFYNKDFIHLMTESVIGNVFGYKLILNDYKLYVHLFNYSGIGRSLIENWSYIKSELGKEGPSVVMLSGTSYAPASAHFNIAKEPTFLLKSEKEEGDINQFINIKYDSSGKLIKISGISNLYIKKERLKELTKQLMIDIKIELSYWRDKGQKRNVLLVVNSYEQCRMIGDYLRERSFKYRVLSKNKKLNKDEINTSQIEEISLMGDVEVLVVPLLIISRGYNIMDKYGDSYFGSAFFMIRPYISPEDLRYNYRILNSIVDPIMAKESQKYKIDKAFLEVSKFAYNMFNQFDEKKFWKHLNPSQREILSWYTFIPIKQAVGRMQRNGCSCRVFYCDGSFVNNLDGKLTDKLSMLKAWETNLLDINKGIGNTLYGRYLKGLTKAISDFEMINDEEELF